MDFVFTVCDDAANETCPIWPGQPMTAHWGVPDPAAAKGTEAVKRAAFADACRMLTNRISIFTSLPLTSLDRLALQKRLDEIGNSGAKTTRQGAGVTDTTAAQTFSLPRRLAAEAIGTAFLVCTVVGSGIMAERLTHDTALALLGNTLPTGAILVVLITVLGPVSGAHFNPAVTLCDAAQGKHHVGRRAGLCRRADRRRNCRHARRASDVRAAALRGVSARADRGPGNGSRRWSPPSAWSP